MAGPLTIADALALRAGARNPWQEKVLRWAVCWCGAVATGIIAVVTADQECPCSPDPVNAAGVGLFLASWAVLAWPAPVLAAVAAWVSALAGLLWDHSHPREASPAAELTLIGYAALAGLVAWLRTRPRPEPEYRHGRRVLPQAIGPTTAETALLIGGAAVTVLGALVGASGLVGQTLTDEDLSPIQLLAMLTIGTGAALLARASAHRRMRRRFTRPQPVAEANVALGHLRAGDTAVARLKISGGPISAADVLVYGIPEPGATVALTPLDGSAVRLARLGPIEAVDEADVPADEIAASTGQLYVHRKPALAGYALSVAAPLVLVELVRRLPTAPAWILAVALTVVSFAAGYVIWLRPAVAWNAGGVAARGVFGSLRARWPDITTITVDGEMVTLSTKDGGVSLVGQRRRGGRTAASLAAGLEHARSRFAPATEVPRLPEHRTPWLFPLLFPIPIAIMMAMQHFS